MEDTKMPMGATLAKGRIQPMPGKTVPTVTEKY